MACNLITLSNIYLYIYIYKCNKYKPVKSPLSELMDNGPGLSYHPDDLLAPTTSAYSIQLVGI